VSTQAPSSISLADLISAVVHLEPDDEAARRIVQLLGLETVVAGLGVDRPLPGAYDSIREAATPPPPATLPRTELPLGVTPQVPPSLAEPPIYVATAELSFDRRVATSPPSWLADPAMPPMQPASKAPAPNGEAALLHEPLFSRLGERAILSAALATETNEGAIDIRKVESRLAERQSIAVLPRLPSSTLRRGVQLLLDHSETFAPYARDREAVTTAIGNVVGRHGVSWLRFRGSPQRGVFAPRKQVAPWRPPPRGTVVALVSDVGIGGPAFSPDRAMETEWLEFAAMVQAAGCPLVAFVPFGPRRWPSSLAHAMVLIQWDRATSVRALRRALGKGHRVSG
jgi:hypothetical protein